MVAWEYRLFMERSVPVPKPLLLSCALALACSPAPASLIASGLDEDGGTVTRSAVARDPVAAPSCDAAALNDVAVEALAKAGAAGAVVVLDLTTGGEIVAVSNADRLDTPTPPASTVKSFLAHAALEGGVVTPAESLTCGGQWSGDGQSLRCFDDHANLDVATAVATSCNAYFYEAVHRLGTDKVADTFDSFGLHGLGKTLRDAPKDQRMAIAVGHGAGVVTPRELAAAFARLVTTPTPAREFVHAGMLEAVERGHGTARLAAVEGMAVAGKTGTAKSAEHNHAWFVGYAPAEAPRVLVLAYVDGEGTGGTLAAPLAAQVLTAWSRTCK